MLAALVALLAPASFDLKPKVREGQEFVYFVEATMAFVGETVPITSRLSVRFVEVRADGGLVVETRQMNAVARMAGREVELPPQRATRTRYSELGDIVGLQGEGSDAIGYRQANANLFRYPEGPVAVGDKWTRSVPANARTGQVAAEATYTVVGEERVGDLPAIRVAYTYRELEGVSATTASGDFWISTTDGWLVRAVREVKNAPLGTSPTPVDMRVTLTRQ